MKPHAILLLLATGGLSMPSCALPPVVDNSSYVTPPPAAAAPVQAPPSNTLYQLISRIDQLELEVRQLTGKLEEQAYQNAELKKRMTTMYSDFDERMQNVENKINRGGDTLPSSESVSEPVLPNAGGSSTVEENPASGSNQQPAPEASPEEPSSQAVPESDTPEPKGNTTQNDSTQPNEAVPADEPTQEKESATISDAENQEFRQAYDALRNGRTAESIDAFNAFISKYPSSPLVADAQYWLGEGYRVNQDSNNARKAFNHLLESYPNSTKVPDALLKLGYIEIDLNNKSKARDYLNQVVNQYPNSNAARHAAKKLASLENSTR